MRKPDAGTRPPGPPPPPPPPPPPGPPPGPGRMDAFLTVLEVAAHLKVDKQTVYRLVWAGQLDRTNIGTGTRPRFRIPAKSVEKFTASRTKGRAA